MLGLVLKKKYTNSSVTTEYVNSMKQLNQAKSNLGAGTFIIEDFGIKSYIRKVISEKKEGKNS